MSDNDNQPQPVTAPPPVAPKKFLTNQGDNTLSKRLEKILPQTHDFDCLVGYFFISGFSRLYPALEPVKNIRILIGLMNEQVIHGLIQIAKDSPEENPPSTAEVKNTFGGMLRRELVEAQDKHHKTDSLATASHAINHAARNAATSTSFIPPISEAHQENHKYRWHGEHRARRTCY